MKYKNYEEVLKSKNPIEAMKEYLADKGMTLREFIITPECKEAAAKAAERRLSGPISYTVQKSNDR